MWTKNQPPARVAAIFSSTCSKRLSLRVRARGIAGRIQPMRIE
jgi:hypothetical protein